MKAPAVVFVLTFVLALSACAQQLTASNTEAPSPVSASEVSAPEPIKPEPIKPEPATIALPEAPHRIADKTFWAATAFQAAAATIDVESTVDMTNRGCTEGWSSWAVGTRPDRATLYASAAASNLATATVAYLLKKHGKRYWWLPQTALGSVHSFAASRNRFLLRCHH